MRALPLLILLTACGPEKPPPAAAAAAGPPSPVDLVLWDSASAAFTAAEGWTVTPLAQVDRGDVHALLVWPMLDPGGRVVDDDVVGLTVQADGTLGASNWRPDLRRLVVELGGDDWQERPRDVGHPQSDLGQAAVARAAAFHDALAVGDPDAARHAAQAFARLFALPLVLDQTVTELLVRQGAWTFDSRRPLVRETWFVFTAGGQPLELLAQPVDEAQTRWVFTRGP